jgi:DNA-binding transcriptional regulator GbsR (MarR family)
MSNPWGKRVPVKKYGYNTVEDFYKEELDRDIDITKASIARMLNMLDKLCREHEKKYLYEMLTQIHRLKESLFPVEVE